MRAHTQPGCTDGGVTKNNTRPPVSKPPPEPWDRTARPAPQPRSATIARHLAFAAMCRLYRSANNPDSELTGPHLWVVITAHCNSLQDEFRSRHVCGPNVLNYGDSHQQRWLRNIVAGQFVWHGLVSFIPFIEQIAEEWTTENLSSGRVEILPAFTNQFPIRVSSNIPGLPREDEDRFVGWHQALIARLGFAGEHLARGIKALDEM